MFWETVLQQPARKDGEQQIAVRLNQEVVLFYEPTCPDCKLLESFLATNGLNEMFSISKKDVTSDPANRAEMESVQKKCMNGMDKRVVPFVTQDGKCAMGAKDSIQFFKTLMWDKVKESKTTMESLLVNGGVPAPVKIHVENHNKMVDAALNCCKE
jgi:glutaredoxin